MRKSISLPRNRSGVGQSAGSNTSRASERRARGGDASGERRGKGDQSTDPSPERAVASGDAEGAGGSAKQTTRAMFEQCLRNQDYGPIVQLHFDLWHGTAAAQLHLLDDKTLQEAATDDKAEAAVPALLHSIADAQADDIAAVCRANAEDLADTVGEMGSMQSVAAQMRSQFVANNDLVQTVGVGLLASLKHWQEITTMQATLASMQTSIQVASHLARYLTRAGHYLLEGRLYHCFTVLQRMRQDPLYIVLDKAGAVKRNTFKRIYQQRLTAIAGADAALGDLAVHGRPPGLGRVAKWIVQQHHAMTNSLQAAAMEQFTQWLVKARAQQGDIGMRAIRRAAGERQVSELLQAQRWEVAAALDKQGSSSTTVVSLDNLAASVVKAKNELSATRRGDAAATTAAARLLHKNRSALIRLPQDVSQADAAPASGPSTGPLSGGNSSNDIKESSFTVSRRMSEADVPLMEGLDMTALSRCVHIHECLGKLSVVRDYYFAQRGLQLKADLNPPADFLQNYQSFISQVVGYFVIEERVSRLGHAGMGGQADGGWELAISKLRSLLESTMENASFADAVLVVKDFMQLAIVALNLYGYHTTPLQSILAQGRSRYVELLLKSADQFANAATMRDNLYPVTLGDQAAYRRAVEEFSLPSVMEGLEPPKRLEFPLQMPFSAVLPELVTLMHRFIGDSAKYLTGLVSRGEVLPAVRQSRDMLLKKVIAEAMDKRIQREIKHPAITFEQCCTAVNNTIALKHAVGMLDHYTVHTLSGAGKREDQEAAEFHLHSSIAARFDTLRLAAEQLCSHALNNKLLSVLRSMKRDAWLPDKPAPNVRESAYISALILEMRQIYNSAVTMLPRNSFCKMVQDTFSYLDLAVLRNVAKDQQIPGYNIFAVQRMFNDCGHMQKFASSLQVPGLVEVLQRPLAFCDLLLFGRVTELAQPARRRALGFDDDERELLVQLLDKYCDAKPPPGSKIPESFVKRKQTEAVAKELRAQAGLKPKHSEEMTAGRTVTDELRDITISESFKRQIGLM